MSGVKDWVDKLIELPVELMELLMDEGHMQEVTPPVWEDEVEIYDDRDGYISGIVKSVDWNERTVVVEDNNCFETYCVDVREVRVIRKDRFPKNDVVWAFRGGEDTRWAYLHYRNIAMAGFRIYEAGDFVVIATEKTDDMYRTYWNRLYSYRKELVA